MVEAAISGIGIAFVPEHLAAGALAEGRLRPVLEDWCPASPGLCLYYPCHRHVTSGIRALINTLTEAAKEPGCSRMCKDRHPEAVKRACCLGPASPDPL